MDENDPDFWIVDANGGGGWSMVVGRSMACWEKRNGSKQEERILVEYDG